MHRRDEPLPLCPDQQRLDRARQPGPGGKPSFDVTLDERAICCQDAIRVLVVSMAMTQRRPSTFTSSSPGR
jgi:hypothetical protein